jgi:hypothetical protein
MLQLIITGEGLIALSQKLTPSIGKIEMKKFIMDLAITE